MQKRNYNNRNSTSNKRKNQITEVENLKENVDCFKMKPVNI